MSALIATPLSHVRPETVRWLWEPYLPRGKLALLDGDPGVGKSLLTIDLAARLSRGATLPGGQPSGQPHVALLLGAEDGAADTVRPRAEAAGADLDRLITATGSGGVSLRFPADAPKLVGLVRDHRPDLVVIDPITAFLQGGVAANADPCVRRVLSVLASLAERFGCAILLVRHLRKAATPRAIYRGLGSVGFIASVRTGLLAARHPSDPGLGVLAVTKANLAGALPSLGYRIVVGGTGRAAVEWTGTVDVSADALAGLPSAPLRPRERAVAWLQAQLAGGPRQVAELLAVAAEAGIPDRTLYRAKAELGVCAHRAKGKERTRWYWYDPAAPWPAIAPFRRPFGLPPLDDGM
jgi:hypothetical protein